MKRNTLLTGLLLVGTGTIPALAADDPDNVPTLKVGEKVAVGGARIYSGGSCEKITLTKFFGNNGAFGKIEKIINCKKNQYVIVAYKVFGYRRVSMFMSEDVMGL